MSLEREIARKRKKRFAKFLVEEFFCEPVLLTDEVIIELVEKKGWKLEKILLAIDQGAMYYNRARNTLMTPIFNMEDIQK